MSARRTTTFARLLIAATGIAGLSASAAAQPDVLRYEGDPVYAESYGHDRIIAHIEIDGDHHDVYECDSVRMGLIEALECAGYHVWTEGYTIVVDICGGEPCISFRSHEYRLSIRRDYHCEEMRLTLRPRHRHHEEVHVEGPIVRRDTYRVEPPAIIFDGSVSYRPGREYERNERPGNRDDHRDGRRYGGRDDRDHGRYDRKPSYETEYLGIGLEIGDDDIEFDLDAGFVVEEPVRRRRP